MQPALKKLVIMGTRTLIVTGASARSARDIRGPSPLVALENEPPPVFGKGALDVSPRVGHVHAWTTHRGTSSRRAAKQCSLVGLPSGSLRKCLTAQTLQIDCHFELGG